MVGTTQSIFFTVRNKEIGVKPRVRLVFGDWMTEYTVFLFKHSIYWNTKVWFADMGAWAREIYFNTSKYVSFEKKFSIGHLLYMESCRWFLWCILHIKCFYNSSQGFATESDQSLLPKPVIIVIIMLERWFWNFSSYAY